ncbi:MAG: hypothetical protein M1281_11385 [Chloroflexi bacterium]|nr:hypothetical protein [Chloroflexota bacterium]
MGLCLRRAIHYAQPIPSIAGIGAAWIGYFRLDVGGVTSLAGGGAMIVG